MVEMPLYEKLLSRASGSFATSGLGGQMFRSALLCRGVRSRNINKINKYKLMMGAKYPRSPDRECVFVSLSVCVCVIKTQLVVLPVQTFSVVRR